MKILYINKYITKKSVPHHHFLSWPRSNHHLRLGRCRTLHANFWCSSHQCRVGFGPSVMLHFITAYMSVTEEYDKASHFRVPDVQNKAICQLSWNRATPKSSMDHHGLVTWYWNQNGDDWGIPPWLWKLPTHLNASTLLIRLFLRTLRLANGRSLQNQQVGRFIFADHQCDA